ncbi:CopD family protein [Methylocystis sp. IM3]|uniref:copper resistance D family protein n=1 Tax=Methylocystis sp. IM3 TaxID=3136722 RepID=UPI0031192D25
MQAFLSIYGMADWILRGVSMVAQTVAVGGALYLPFMLAPLEGPASGRVGLWRFCRRVLVSSALVLCLGQALTAVALTAFLMGSTGADLATAMSADAVIFDLLSACAALALASVARRASGATAALVLLSVVLVGAHAGVTHAASRSQPAAALLAAETLHLFALAAWIGGVPYFIASLRMLEDRGQRAAVAARFSLVSLAAVALLVATGVFMSVPYVGTPEGLYQTTYGLLLGAKAVLLALLLCMGAVNLHAVRRQRRDGCAALRSLPVLAEAEVGVGVIAILCAVALASSPLAADTRAARPDASEISKRFELAWPRLASPAPPPLAADGLRGPSPASAAGGDVFEDETARSPFDIAWSEAHHHYAALFVVATGLVALVSRSGRLGRLGRRWPLLFLALAAYLFIVADEDAWPLGPTGFFESLANPRIAQHKLMIALVAALALVEWRAQAKKFRAAWPSFIFPLTIAGAAALLLTHYGHSGDKQEVLVEISHTPVALLGVIAAAARWLELRLPSPALGRVAGLVWPVAFIAAGAVLLLYRESA